MGTKLLSVFTKASQTFIGMGVNRIPGIPTLHYLLSELLWLSAKEGIIETEGSQMYVDPHIKEPMRTAFRGYIRLRGKEKLTTELFKQVVKPHHTVVDIGANIGYFTLLAARLGGKVYAFEPEQENYKILTRNIRLNGYTNITTIQKAVSNTTGTANLYLSSKDIGAHTLRRYHNKSQFDTKVSGGYTNVETVTLDEFFPKEQSIDVIKMDIEGAEMAALSGMGRIIRENKDLKIFTEFYPSGIREMGYSPEKFITKLFGYGFSILVIDELRSPTHQYIRIRTVKELMGLCKDDEEKIVNLYCRR